MCNTLSDLPLLQARKATLGNSRVSTDGGPGRQPNTPRSMAAAGGRRGPGGNSFPSNPSLGGLGGSFGGLDNLNPGRRSFEIQGYPGSLGGVWPRGPAGLSPGMGGLGGMSSSLGALAGTPPGMQAAAMAQGRNRRNSFEYGMGPLGGPSALQMLQGAGGFDVSTAGNLDQQLQLLMTMTGTAGDPNAFAAAAGGLMGMPGGQPGTPTPGGMRGNPMGAGNAGGLLSPPMSAAAAFGGMPGLSTPPGAFVGGPGPGGFYGGNSATSPAGQGSLFSPPNNMMGGGRPGVGAMMAGGLGMEGQQGGVQRQVLVTGLPPGLTDGDLRALFEICGPLRSVNKQHDQVSLPDVAVSVSCQDWLYTSAFAVLSMRWRAGKVHGLLCAALKRYWELCSDQYCACSVFPPFPSAPDRILPSSPMTLLSMHARPSLFWTEPSCPLALPCPFSSSTCAQA